MSHGPAILPINIPKRGLSIDEAAEYIGVSKNTLTRHGPAPTKIGERTVYDRRMLDRWLDELGGFNTAGMTPEESLLEAINARKNSLRHASD